MSEDNNNSNNDLSREELDEELDKVKKSVRPKSLLKRAGVVTCYRTSQPDEPDQGQEDHDELDRTDESNSKKTDQAKSHSLWSRLLSSLWTIVSTCILLPIVIIITLLLLPFRICRAFFSHKDKDFVFSPTCYAAGRYDDEFFFERTLVILLIIGGLIYLIYSLIKYFLF